MVSIPRTGAGDVSSCSVTISWCVGMCSDGDDNAAGSVRLQLDEDFRTWLIEVNTNPYLGVQNPWHGRTHGIA
jgi:hypothetical protein